MTLCRLQCDVISTSCARWVIYLHCVEQKLGNLLELHLLLYFDIQSTLVISKLKGPSETLRDIHTSTYQIFRIEVNTNRTTNFTNECVIRLLKLEIYLENSVGMGGEIAPEEQFLLLTTIFCNLMLDFYV